MAFLQDLRVLYHLAFSPIKGGTHQERLESFYSGQADAYDDFRKRLLKGRRELYRSLPIKPGAVWVDMGGGTGANLEFIADRVPKLGKVYVVDLSTSLLDVARARIEARGWSNVEAVEADVIEFALPAGVQADVITFSYSLTMIPDWFAAIDRARELLKPGGHMGVVDFYVARKFATAPHHRHGWARRHFWPTWFASDNVFPSPDHLPYLERRFQKRSLHEHLGKVPYMMGARAPYYRFVGTKPKGG